MIGRVGVFGGVGVDESGGAGAYRLCGVAVCEGYQCDSGESGRVVSVARGGWACLFRGTSGGGCACPLGLCMVGGCPGMVEMQAGF